MKHKTTNGLWTIAFVLISTYVFAKFQGGFVSWFIFYTVTPIGILSLLTYILAFKGVKLQRVMEKKKYSAGQKVMVRIKVSNPYRAPFIYVLMKDRVSSISNRSTGQYRQLIYPGFRKEFDIVYKIEDIPRGVYRWENITLETGDLFGLVKREREFLTHEEIVVYPKVYDIRFWRTLNEKNTGTSYSFNRQDEDISSVMGIREYAPGDRLARIHWKATARTNQLKTKEYEHQVTNDFMFFLDREIQSYGEKGAETFERGVSLVASLTRFAIRQRFSAGLVSYGREANVIPQSKGQEQVYRIYEHLARIQADTTLPFVKTVLREVSYLPIGTTVVLVTPKLTKKMAMMASDLSYRKVKVEFFWLKDPSDMTTQERTSLQLLEQSHIPYHFIKDTNFSDAISGGDRHASA